MSMQFWNKGTMRYFAVALAVLVAGCGSSANSAGDNGTAAPANGTPADDSLAPVKIGLIAQDTELVSIPEVRASAQATVDYINAELKGVDGHPVELDVCGAGDAPESHVACAQQFVNDDKVRIVINAGLGTNTAASNAILKEGGVATFTIGNDIGESTTEGIYAFDSGALGVVQAAFAHADRICT